LQRPAGGGYNAALVFIKSVCKCSCCWFVDDAKDIKPCKFACIFCCLTLCVVKVCWYGDDCICHGLAQKIFSRSLQSLQYDS